MLPFSPIPLSFTGLLGSLVMVGDGGTISGGTAKNCRSVNRLFGRESGGKGFVTTAMNQTYPQMSKSLVIDNSYPKQVR